MSEGYKHPTAIEEFEKVYRQEYVQNIECCDRWIEWCKKQDDFYGVNFHQGMRSAHVFNDIKMCQLIRILKQEEPNVNVIAAQLSKYVSDEQTHGTHAELAAKCENLSDALAMAENKIVELERDSKQK